MFCKMCNKQEIPKKLHSQCVCQECYDQLMFRAKELESISHLIESATKHNLMIEVLYNIVNTLSIYSSKTIPEICNDALRDWDL